MTYLIICLWEWHFGYRGYSNDWWKPSGLWDGQNTCRSDTDRQTDRRRHAKQQQHNNNIVNLRVELPNEVGHGLAVDIACGRGEGRVDVGVRVHPHDTQVPRDGRRVPMDGANRQAEWQSKQLSEGGTSWVREGPANLQNDMLNNSHNLYYRSCWNNTWWA